jgi:hypothetical protein
MRDIVIKATISLTAPLLCQSPVAAYPQVEMDACMQNAFNAAAQKGLRATYKDLQKYCDCSSRKILDEGKEITSSIQYCNKKFIR